jgi:hypothetical protein
MRAIACPLEVAKGENLLGSQFGEPENLTIRAGRSLQIGARAAF